MVLIMLNERIQSQLGKLFSEIVRDIPQAHSNEGDAADICNASSNYFVDGLKGKAVNIRTILSETGLGEDKLEEATNTVIINATKAYAMNFDLKLGVLPDENVPSFIEDATTMDIG